MKNNYLKQHKLTGILVSGFPRISETFILNELLQLQYQGARFEIFALKPGQKNVHADFQKLYAPLHYLPNRVTISVILHGLLAAFNLGFSRRKKFLRVLGQIWIGGKKERDYTRWQSTWRWLWLCDKLAESGITHLHAHFAHDPASMAHWASQLLDIPFSFTGHAKDIYCYPQELLQQKIHAAQFVVTCTHHNVGNLQDVSQNGTPIHCLYHGIDFDKFRPGNAPKADPPMLISVGRLIEKKGFEYLIEACKFLKNNGLDFSCEIVGDGPLREKLAAQISDAGLRDTVFLRGQLTHSELVPLYQRAAMFVSANFITESGDRDGIPNVIIEAMAMELPVVSTTISGIPEAVANGETGLLVSEKNSEELAAAIEQLLVDATDRMQMGKAARRRAMALFSLQNNVQKLKELLVA